MQRKFENGVIIYCAHLEPRQAARISARRAGFRRRALPHRPAARGNRRDVRRERASQKALYYGAHVDGYLFADDSGSEVDALGGAPGVHSARFAGTDATDADNNALLLERLRGVENRAARFVCVIALVRDGQLVADFSRRQSKAESSTSRAGRSGFGYDPLFYYEPFGCTFGEADYRRENARQPSRAGAGGDVYFLAK